MNTMGTPARRARSAEQYRPNRRDRLRHTLRPAVLTLALAGGLYAGAMAPAAAATSASAPTSSAAAAPSAHQTVTPPKANAPAAATANPANAGSALTWTISLTADDQNPLPGYGSDLTATANADVSSQKLYIDIIDLNTNALIAECSAGSSCSGTVVQNAGTNQQYQAYITDAASFGAGHDLALSNLVDVNWPTLNVILTVTNGVHTLPVLGKSTVTATATADLSDSPFVIRIFHNGVPVVSCATSSTCSAAAYEPFATTQNYDAEIFSIQPGFPVYATSTVQYITWSNSGLHISLTAPATTTGPETVTAVASVDVGPTPYYIEIFDRNGHQLAMCGAGTNCSVVGYTPAAAPGSQLVAYICLDRGAAAPPINSDSMAVSNTVATTST